MKKTLIPTILSLIFLTQANLAIAESVSFQLSVILPSTVEMTSPALESQNNIILASVDQRPTQMVQEQQMIRGAKEVLVRSIVAL